jgi:RNA polymerase sigma factor (sigma-70 family)
MRTPLAPLSEERRELAARYVPMARGIAESFGRKWPRLADEFESAAMMALVESASRFDESKNVKYSTYARLRIIGAMSDVMRIAMSPARMHVASFVESQEDYVVVLNTTPDPPVGHEAEHAEAIRDMARKLPKRHGAVFAMVHADGMIHADIARRLGLSVCRIDDVHAEAVAMLNGTWIEFYEKSAARRRRRADERRRIADAPQHSNKAI